MAIQREIRGKKHVWGALIVLCLAGALAGCGSSSSSTTPGTQPLSGVAKRVLVSNTSTNTINIINAAKDQGVAKSFGANGPTKMVTAGGTTFIMSSIANQVVVLDNKTETVTGTGLVADIPFDIVAMPDGKSGWAAVRNPGFVQKIDVATGNILVTVAVPSVSRLVLSPNGTKLLAFVDDASSIPNNPNSFFVIDTANPPATGTPITLNAGDQPFSGVFNGSETSVFVLNCGKECGGTNSASVVRVDLTGAAPNATVTGGVNAATVGLISGGKLYVAGTAPATTVGGATSPSLQVIDTATLVAGAPIPITDGRHGLMAMSANNHLYIGATGCTPGAVDAQNNLRGCLSIFNTGAAASSTNPVFPLESVFRQNYDVTAFQQVSGRNVMYVCQGAEFDIFDITTDALASSITQIDIVGKVFGAVQIDP